MRRLLVTGGAGFIGANFVHYWMDRHRQDRIVVLDSLTYAGNSANLHGLDERSSYRFVQGDVRDEELVLELMIEERVDTVVHFAAESHVDRSIGGPDDFISTNILGTYALLKAARKAWDADRNGLMHRRFHQVSTDEVHGSLTEDGRPFDESTPYAPNSPYSASKAAADHLARAFNRTYGLPVTISNCSNNYGPYQHPEKLLPLATTRLLTGQRVPIYGEGANIRDWLYVTDHCRALELILRGGRNGEVYHVGGEEERTNLSLILLLCRIVDGLFAQVPAMRERYPDCPAAQGMACRELIRFVDDRPGHDLRYAINTTKIAADLGFRHRETLAGGLRKTVRWYADHPGWWQFSDAESQASAEPWQSQLVAGAQTAAVRRSTSL